MATVITSECINCGACEPECPNTAIYQGGVEWEFEGTMRPALSNEIFYIVPEKCTECVGFFDQEACAAVCPVDCCVPDPNRPETEAVLLERAKVLHPETTFGENFPSRFRESAAAAPAAGTPAPAAAAVTVAPAVGEAGPVSAAPVIDEWEVPIVCRECTGEYTVAFQYLRPGVVFYCPHCQASFVPTSTTYLEIAGALERFSTQWHATFESFQAERRRELAQFEIRQREQLEAFEDRMRDFTRDGQKATGTRRRWF
jgi:ferredoxin